MSGVAALHGLTVAAPDGTVILDRVDLELPAATVTALIGESGAGKTTLAHALLGHLGPGLRRISGTARVAGHDPFTRTGQRALRGQVTAYLPQDPASALNPRRTILGHLRTAARISHPGERRAARSDRIRAAAEAAAFDAELLHRHASRLSGGQAQRALLAWTFVTRPELLILDEPTSGLDPVTALRVGTAFASLPWRPAVLLISHDRDLVAHTAGCAWQLTAGQLRSVAAAPPHKPAAAATAVAGPTSVPPVGPAVLAADRLTIHRGASRLLSEASLTLHAGELVAVQGPSGSGKTSLARTLCGLAPPTAGRLSVQGRPVAWEAATRARAGGPFVAYVGQDARAALHPQERIRRTLTRALAAGARRGPAVDPDLTGLLKRFGLPDDVLDRTPDRLSGGQRHRVALARAIAAAPTVLVCDETTASLDRVTRELVLDALDELRRHTGLPVLAVTHQDAVAARADRVLTLTGGDLR
ncbi:ABC transporter ATP-binding protein [Natronosporangium hydrolyticum]|uniref:ABC transporter ATP-binding protein n=1 Tax=Natronosporangium hydrolyticum TaxID=2811111 RepID=A0A895YRB6_9ACTN|nr:ATP-binding cassette domain-containing protein [Natronosporangium hydrolyticum]QSB16660.1 ABC transporter ATP-binding protein [Natronosporangium hydrolyticum]